MSALRGELIKTVTTRTVLGYAVVGVALALANVLIMTLSQDLVTVAEKREAIAGLPILLVLFAIVGGAGEYRHRTAAPAALMAGGDRGRLLLARAGAYALTGVAIGVPLVAVSLAVGLPLLAGEPGPGLGLRELAVAGGGSLLAAAWSAIMGVAAGALLRNQVAGVIGALMLALVIGPLLHALNEAIVGYTPFGAATLVAGDPAGGALSWGGAALVLATWTAALLVAAVAVERRRDLA
jgi:ABC-2 type transport system permease protein